MRNFQQKRGWRNILESIPVLVFLGFLVLFFIWNILGFWIKMGETSKNKKIAENKVAMLKQQKEQLGADIASLQTQEGKEKLFRENFGLAKEGENLIVVIEDKNPPTSTEPASSPFWSFLKNLFR